MLLSDGEINEEILDRQDFKLTGRGIGNIQPASVDLTMGHQVKRQIKTGFAVGLNNPPQFDLIEMDKGEPKVWLYPGEFYLAHTIEIIKLPPDIAGLLTGKSTWGRMGLSIHSCAGWIDPGFDGQITLEIKVDGRDPVEVKYGDPIAQISFFRTGQPARVPYGEGRGSRYQGQQGAKEMVVRG